MWPKVWSFLAEDHNQAVLGWIGSGVVAMAGGVWAVFKYVLSNRTTKKSAPALTVHATRGSIAAGRDVRDTKIDTGSAPKR
jgi:hypothetical protein